MEARENLQNNSWIDYETLPESIKIQFEELWNLHPEQYNQVKILGKIVETPRWQQTYGRSYNYTGMVHEALPIPQQLQPFLEYAQKLYPEFVFNQILINWYQNGLHYIGAHSDNTKPLVKDSPIVSISLGEERIFRIKEKQTKKKVKDIILKDKIVITMGGEFQTHYTHEVPKITGKKGEQLGRRINITFRCFKGDEVPLI